jgi:hypothetical protein
MRKRNLFRVVLLGMLLMPLSCAATKWPALSKMPQSPGLSLFDSRPLPFSFDQVISYFDDAFERRAQRIESNFCVYIEGNGPDESVIMAICSREGKIVVTLIANGDWGVNYIREFFEAPFFLRSESEQLYALLDANPGARAATLGRFDVEIDVFETREWIVITAEFGPPGSYEVPLVRPEHTA